MVSVAGSCPGQVFAGSCPGQVFAGKVHGEVLEGSKEPCLKKTQGKKLSPQILAVRVGVLAVAFSIRMILSLYFAGV